MSNIPQAHPLFREVMAHAFTEHERFALDLVMNRSVPKDLAAALRASATNGWAEAIERIAERAAESKVELNFNYALYYAALQGHLAAIREAIKLGADAFSWAMAAAALNGHYEAMRVLGHLAPKPELIDFDWALLNAAEGGHLDAMRTAREWGATAFDRALDRARYKNHLAAVDLLKAWVAEDRAIILSAGAADS
jgi:hypothetical protein